MTRAGIQVELEASGFHVTAFADATSCLARLPSLTVDAVVCDLYLADEASPPALALIVRLTEMGHRVVVYSTWALDPDVLGSLDAGAVGFLQKSERVEPLVQVVRRVTATGGTDGPVLTPEVAAALRRRERFGLTAAELEVLGHLAQHLTNHEIAQLRGVSEETVKTQLASIRTKLGATNRATAVRAAHRHGLVGRWRRVDPAS